MDQEAPTGWTVETAEASSDPGGDIISDDESISEFSGLPSEATLTRPPLIPGIRVDFDGESLHTNDTDVESWHGYEDLTHLEDFLEHPHESSDENSIPNLGKLADSKPDAEELVAHCQACDELDWGFMIKCSRQYHEEDEGWYHFHCAEVSAENWLSLEEWYCPTCRPRSEFAQVAGKPVTGGKGMSTLKMPLTQICRPALVSISQNALIVKEKAALRRPDLNLIQTPRKATLSSPVIGPSHYEIDSEASHDTIREQAQSVNYAPTKITNSVSPSTSATFIPPASSTPTYTKDQGKATAPKSVVNPRSATAPSSEPRKKQAKTLYSEAGGTLEPASNVITEKNLVKARWLDPIESQALASLMVELLASSEAEDMEVKGTDHKWKVLACRLRERYGYHRTVNSVKNYWQRTCRARYGIDERIVAKPDRMSTCVQDPADRKQRREEKKRQLAEASSQSASAIAANDATTITHVQKRAIKRKRDHNHISEEEELTTSHPHRRPTNWRGSLGLESRQLGG